MDEYEQTFVDESQEAITELTTLVLDLERDPADDDVLDGIFRTAHTVKGNAGAMGLDPVTDLAHALEDLLDGIRTETVSVTTERIDSIFDAIDDLEAMIGEMATGGSIETDPTATIETLREPLTDGEPSAGSGDDSRPDSNLDAESGQESDLDNSDATNAVDRESAVDMANTVDTETSSIDRSTDDTLESPDDGTVDALLQVVDRAIDPAHEAYFARLEIDDEAGEQSGLLVVEALVDAFDLLVTDPSWAAIEDDAYEGFIDVVFASPVERVSIAAALDRVETVRSVHLEAVTERLAAARSPTTGEDLVDAELDVDLSTNEAQALSVDELLEEFDGLDDIDTLAKEVGDVSAFEDIDDAGSFDDLIDDESDDEMVDEVDGSDTDEADSEPLAGEADDETDDVEDASAVFAELQEEVEMVGFDELQAELDELEFDQFDEEEVGMDELLGDDVDLDDPSFLDVEEPAEAGVETDEGTASPSVGSDAVEADDGDVEAAIGNEGAIADHTADDTDETADDDGSPDNESDGTPGDESDGASDDESDDAPDVDEDRTDEDDAVREEDGIDPPSTGGVKTGGRPDWIANAQSGVNDGESTVSENADRSESVDGGVEAPADEAEEAPAVSDVEVTASGDVDDPGVTDDETAAVEDAKPSTEFEEVIEEPDVASTTDADPDEFATALFDPAADPITKSAFEDEGSFEDAGSFEDTESFEDAGSFEDAELVEDAESFEDDGSFEDAESFEDDGSFEDAESFEDAGSFDVATDLESQAVDGFDDGTEEGDEVVTAVDETTPESWDDPDGDDDTAFDLSADPPVDIDADAAFDSEGVADLTFDASAGSTGESTVAFDESTEETGDPILDGIARMETPDIEVPDPESVELEEELDTPAGTIRVDHESVDTLLQLVEGLVTTRVRLRSAVDRREPHEVLARELDDLDAITADLQETVLDVRLVPLETVTNRLPRVIRDLAREQDKAVSLEQTNQSVEVDRGILERLGDPLIHLVRNAVDHGIEPATERADAGKPETATITLDAERSRNRVTITIGDDGRGLDVDGIREAAVEAGVVTAEEADAMDETAIYDLVFHPGLSTATEVTDVSGRGVGMDVVRRTVEELNGTVSIDSTPGEGTTVSVTLPVSVAIDDVLFVKSGGEAYGVPVDIVEEVGSGRDVTESDDELVFTEANGSVPAIRIGEALEAPEPVDETAGMVVRIRDDVRDVALQCDEIEGSREVVVKPFEGFLRSVPGVGGATVRGRGEVVPILDVTTI